MKSYHEFHGITWGDCECDWVAQFRLFGKPRRLRLFCSSAEAAARRHDFALYYLLDFAEPTARYNFDDVLPQKDVDDGHKDFEFVLQELKDKLVSEFDLTGRNFDAYADEKSAIRSQLKREREVGFTQDVWALQRALAKARTRALELPWSSPDVKQAWLKQLDTMVESLPEGMTSGVKSLLTIPGLMRAEQAKTMREDV